MPPKKYTNYEKKLREYYLKCFLSEFSKIIIFLVLFSLLGLTKEYIVALIFLILLRSNGGGLHYKHYSSCLIVSFFFLYASIFFATNIRLPLIFNYIIAVLCIFAGYGLVPITSGNRPAATINQIKKSKQNTTLILLLIFIMLCISSSNTYFLIGHWTATLHVIQLIIAYASKEVTKC